MLFRCRFRYISIYVDIFLDKDIDRDTDMDVNIDISCEPESILGSENTGVNAIASKTIMEVTSTK